MNPGREKRIGRSQPSNQSAVAWGIITEKVLAQVHNRSQQLLAEKGASIDRIYYCPYHPEGVVAKYRQESDWRKPKPGMLLACRLIGVSFGPVHNRDMPAGAELQDHLHKPL